MNTSFASFLNQPFIQTMLIVSAVIVILIIAFAIAYKIYKNR